MSDIAIRVENLSKQYRIGKAQQRHDTLRDAVVDLGQRLSGRLFSNPQSAIPNPQSDDVFWALKDVSFEVKRGEVVGIIGRNGAGKSTLLKILSQITEPTSGRAEIHGRVASLLEVGTGFHPELTGRENIYLNGAILGMRREEINRQFDEIVAFAEIEKFLDTPVKRYSSGMYVRLAFAVAAHLEPEILLVDEVLAVGDAAFQKKCLGKIGDIAKKRRTVLFVSHNLIALQSLCERALWLEVGQLFEQGLSSEVVSNYMRLTQSNMNLLHQRWDDQATAPGNDLIRLQSISIRTDETKDPSHITMEAPFIIEVGYWNLIVQAVFHINLKFFTEYGIQAFTTSSASESKWRGQALPTGLVVSRCEVPGNLLNSGGYRVLLTVVKDLSSVVFRMEDALTFTVVDSNSREGAWFGRESGVVQPRLNWTTYCIEHKT